MRNHVRLDYVLYSGGFGILTLLFLFSGSGCFPGNPASYRVIDSKGTVLKPADDPQAETFVIPSTGSESFDYFVYAIAAGLYGIIGYYARKVKVNGVAQNVELQRQIEELRTRLEKAESVRKE